MSINQRINLSTFNQLIKKRLAVFSQRSLWVIAEIAAIKSSGSGHYYLELVEKHDGSIIAKMQATIWYSQMMRIRTKFGTDTNYLLKVGNKVLFKCSLNFHEVYGLKVNITDLDPSITLGKLEAQRLEIIMQLKAEELMDLNSTLPLPMVLQKIAVISSSTAAGYGDFINHLQHNPYGYHIKHTLYQAAMQGDQVEKDLLTQLKVIAHHQAQYDLVVIIRGGGSKLDLQYFNNYKIGKAIAMHPLPVLTGIGHQQDETIADMVAHTALKTPTAVADFILQSLVLYESKVINLFEELKHSALLLTQSAQHQLQGLSVNLQYSSQQNLSNQNNEIDLLQLKTKQNSQQLLQKRKNDWLLFMEHWHTCRNEFQTELTNQSYQLKRIIQKLKYIQKQHFLIKNNNLDLLAFKNQQLSRYTLRNNGQKLDQIEQIIQITTVAKLLKKGYSIVRKNGVIINSIQQLSKGDRLQIQMSDGNIDFIVA